MNIGSQLEKEVEGRISTEIDARLANDQDAIIERAKSIMAMYKESGVGLERLLLRIPATWEGIQAAGELEKQGIQVHCTAVYSYAQAVLASRTGVSVISFNLRATQDEYQKMPGLIKDPTGPREDSGFGSGVDPAIKLVQSIYAMLKQTDSSTKLLVTGVRSAKDALSLAGADYLVLSDKIIRQLAARPTLEGYNTGLSSDALSEEPLPELEKVKDEKIRPVEEVDGSKGAFVAEVGVAGNDLLQSSLSRLTEDVARMRTYFDEVATG